jgi:hypothetical protein
MAGAFPRCDRVVAVPDLWHAPGAGPVKAIFRRYQSGIAGKQDSGGGMLPLSVVT